MQAFTTVTHITDTSFTASFVTLCMNTATRLHDNLIIDHPNETWGMSRVKKKQQLANQDFFFLNRQ